MENKKPITKRKKKNPYVKELIKLRQSFNEMKLECSLKEMNMINKFNKLEQQRLRDKKREKLLKILLIIVLVIMTIIKGLTFEAIQDLLLKLLGYM